MALKRFASWATGGGTETNEAKRYRNAIDGMADEWICPITHELPVDPVMAEDSRYYERSAIEQWFKSVTGANRSPVTNVPMGRVLKAGPQVRNTIKKMVESGAIRGAKADAWKKRIEEEATVTRLRQRCKDGSPYAMKTLGYMYRDGRSGLAKDRGAAFMWCKQAADLHDPEALGDIAQMYCEGDGVQRNATRGAFFLGQAAVLGVEHACYVLAVYYRFGLHGFEKDAALAAYWYKKMSTCPVQDSTEACRKQVAEWLRSHPVQLTS